MYEDHVIIKQKAIQASKTKHHEESYICPNDSRSLCFFLPGEKLIEFKPITVLPVSSYQICEEDQDGIQYRPDAYPPNDFIVDPRKTVHELFADKGQDEADGEGYGIRQDATDDNHKVLIKSERCILNSNLIYPGCKLSNRHAQYQTANVLSNIMSEYSEEEQKEDVKQSKLEFHRFSLAPFQVCHDFIPDVP